MQLEEDPELTASGSSPLPNTRSTAGHSHSGGTSAGEQISPGERVRRVAVQLAALSQNGITFAQDPYDQVRYSQAADLAAELLSVVVDAPANDLRLELERDCGYATPKVDVRGVVFDQDERVLLMRERSDGLWSLPGGWADPLDTPRDAVVREIAEETGHRAEVVRLIACYDRDTQGHLPKMSVAVYKLFFLCRLVGQPGEAQALETLEVGWFALDSLPALSMGRVHDDQLVRALAHHRDSALQPDVD